MEVTIGKAGFIFDWAYPPVEEEKAATAFISLLNENIGVSSRPSGLLALKGRNAVAEASGVSGSPSQSQDTNADRETSTATDYMTDCDYVPLRVSEKSFIRARTSKDGLATGPEALFGKSAS